MRAFSRGKTRRVHSLHGTRPGAAGMGSLPNETGLVGSVAVGKRPGKGQTQALVLVAAGEPDSERAAEAAALSYMGRAARREVGGRVRAASLCSGRSNGSPGLNLQLPVQGGAAGLEQTQCWDGRVYKAVSVSSCDQAPSAIRGRGQLWLVLGTREAGAVWGWGMRWFARTSVGTRGWGRAVPPQAPQPLEEDPCQERPPFTNSPTTACYKAWPAE